MKPSKCRVSPEPLKFAQPKRKTIIRDVNDIIDESLRQATEDDIQ